MNKGRDTVLIVDEAQAIHDVAIFEELRLLLNFQLNDRFLLTFILLGQPELSTKVELFAQFSQGIVKRYPWPRFFSNELVDYTVSGFRRAEAYRLFLCRKSWRGS